uniref:Uncharacterized protein n=1 Tax=Peronospora matthiolae TaxID=2874970 RepID=A0AAV1UMM8_9STRA
MEAEFVAASEQTRELLGFCFRNILSEIWIPPRLPLMLYIDNQAAIKQLDGNSSSSKAKHFDMRLNYVRCYSRHEIISAQYVRTEVQIAENNDEGPGGGQACVTVQVNETRVGAGLKKEKGINGAAAEEECQRKICTWTRGGEMRLTTLSLFSV